jgi:hypothetical protein
MTDFIVFIVIVLWIISSAVRAFKAMGKPPAPSREPRVTIDSAPLPRARKKSQLLPPSGYAGRNLSETSADYGRAVAYRPAETASYTAQQIVDRGLERQFANQVSGLIATEPRPAPVRTVKLPLNSPAESQNQQLISGQLFDQNSSSLIQGIILAEVLGPPLCKTFGAKRLRR